MAHLEVKFRTLVHLSALFFITDLLSSSTINADDVAFMSKFAKALNPTPSGWSQNTSFCTWEGIKCDNSNHVTSINLASKSLTGKIPLGLNALFFLRSLDLSNNSLTGRLPSLANLTFLQEVYLNHNNFTSIPKGCFVGLTTLNTLTLSYNTELASWTFPTDLNHSSSLVHLHLVATNLMGPLPEIFHSFPSLQILLLSNNYLNGALPKSFALSQVATLWVNDQGSNRGLSGTIEVLSSMTNLSQVWLQWNAFEGPIPDLSNCTNLVDLQLRSNQLTGVVPPSLISLSSLRSISLDYNFLQGPVPVFGKGVNVTLDFTTNGFCLNQAGLCDQRVTTLLEIAAAFGYPFVLAESWQGNDPCENWNFVVCIGGKVRDVDLAKQDLTGMISPAFSNLTDLWNLDLSGNNLRGSIPEGLTTLPELVILDVSNNNLSGEVPKFSPRVKLNTTGNVLRQSSEGGGISTGSPSNQSSEGGGISTGSPSKTSTGLIAGGALAATTIGVIIFVVIICNRKRCLSLVQRNVFKKTKTSLDQNVEEFMKNYSSLTAKQYSYSEVKKMTNSFHHKLGQGGFGVVYKASLPDGRQVAIKVISESKGSGEEFINEVASISKTSHVNIVSLLGFCYERNKRVLIYEFMPNGSLDKFIHKRGSPNAICNLDWSILYKIAIGIAQGLEYLHRGCSTRILHLDIKPQNILLDEDFCPKISDFGLAKLCKKKESIVSILGTRGTVGYIAPEVFSRAYGGVSHKSDVYSYGMLILEMIGGRKNHYSGGSHTSELYFPYWIYKDLEQGNIHSSCVLITNEENEIVRKMTMVSLWCIQTNPANRPSMNRIIEMLEGPLQSVPFPPKPAPYSPNIAPLQFSEISSSSIETA